MLKILMMLTISFSTYAFEEIWKLGDDYIPLINNPKTKTLVSKKCSNGKCDALLILKKISMKNMNADKLQGGKNPGAVLCNELTDAKVIYLKDMKGNENSFCLLPDKSMISTSTLMVFANKNDGVSK